MHFNQLQFNSKHAILGVGLWPNFIIWECIQFCLLAHFELEKVFKKLDYRIFSMNKIFTEILLCDTLSWKNEYIVLLLSADKNVWHTPWSMIGVCAVFAHYRHRTATWLWLENVSTAINVYSACAITPIYLFVGGVQCWADLRTIYFT